VSFVLFAKGTVCLCVPNGVPAPEMSAKCGGVLYICAPPKNIRIAEIFIDIILWC
jgi:hypothetical protein